MPAKSTPKKIPVKEKLEPEVVHDTPHPQIIPKNEPAPVEEAHQEVDLEEMLEDDGDESGLEKKNTVMYAVGMVLTAGIIASTIGIYILYVNSPKVTKPNIASNEAFAPSPTPVSVPQPASISFEVLNASGVPGAAAKGAAKLIGKGYTVVLTGNTKKQGTSQLLLSASVSSPQLSALLSDLTVLFGISSSSGALTDSTATARLILGVK